MTTSLTGKKKPVISETENSQALMLKAQANALNAREEARKTIEQIYEKHRHYNTLDETLVRIFGETEQAISQQTRELLKKNSTDTLEEDNKGQSSSISFIDKLPIDIYPEIKRKTVNPQIQHSTDNLSEENIQKEIEDFIEETRRIKKEAQQALNEADITRQAARLTVSRAKHEALKMAEDEIARSQEETRIIRENADISVRQAHEEAETARNHARVAISLAQDKVKEVTEIMAQAREENRQVKEAARTARQEAAEAIRQAHEESHQAKEKAEASIRKVNEQVTRARQMITDSTLQENDLQPVRKILSDQEILPPEVPIAPPQPEIDKDLTNDGLKEMYDPLHSISGFARMMLDDNIADRAAQKEFLAIILQQSEALKQKLDGLSH